MSQDFRELSPKEILQNRILALVRSYERGIISSAEFAQGFVTKTVFDFNDAMVFESFQLLPLPLQTFVKTFLMDQNKENFSWIPFMIGGSFDDRHIARLRAGMIELHSKL